MGLLSIEHSRFAYRADFALYGAAVLSLAGWSHHWRGTSAWLKRRKRWHALHHHAAQPGCYGAVRPLWDPVFGSVGQPALSSVATCADVGKRRRQGEAFRPPPGWDSGCESGGREVGNHGGARDFDHKDFFKPLFGGPRPGAGRARCGPGARPARPERHAAGAAAARRR